MKKPYKKGKPTVINLSPAEQKAFNALWTMIQDRIRLSLTMKPYTSNGEKLPPNTQVIPGAILRTKSGKPRKFRLLKLKK